MQVNLAKLSKFAVARARFAPHTNLPPMLLLSKILFLLALLLSFTGLLSPPVALTLGILFGLCFAVHPYAAATRASARILLQACVVALGFGMNLHEVLEKPGRSGFLYTALGISFALLAGLALGKLLKVRGNSSFLITAGTAICAAAPSPPSAPSSMQMTKR